MHTKQDKVTCTERRIHTAADLVALQSERSLDQWIAAKLEVCFLVCDINSATYQCNQVCTVPGPTERAACKARLV